MSQRRPEDTATADPRLSPPGESGGPAASPQLELLFHYALERVGARTAAGAFDADGALELGRDAPAFAPPGGERAAAPLADPCISRRQISVRWLPDKRAFAVATAEGAKLGLRVWPGGLLGEPIGVANREAPLVAPPGTIVALGDRVLLRLCHEPVRAAERARLGMIGESAALWSLRERIERVGRFKDCVLVLGETGSGKEHVAAAIHAASGRTGRFVALNLSRLDPELANAELFGHARGAFTGAHRDRAGAFEEARGGTLFLDEIGDSAPEVQKKLLRVLEDGKVARLGESRETEVDVRVVAATHRDLAAEVQSGAFRLDLFERLGALGVSVPPLRAHPTDVPALFVHFLRERTREHAGLRWLWREDVDSDAPPVPLETFLDLLRRPWPGNVRELRNYVAEVAALNLDGRAFVAPALAPTPTLAPAPAEVSQAAAPAVPDRATASRKPAPRDAIVAALEEADFNQSTAAARLGVSRTTLLDWMKAQDIRRPKDLSEDELLAAQKEHGDDVDSMARALRVSARGLKLHLRRR
jgi:DNA-binding NtrC family response regulator